MASGFGTFVSGTTVSNGATVAATLYQSIDSNNRTVTVTLRMTAAYRRIASGSWTPGSGVAIWGSQHTGNYMTGTVGGNTDGISGVSIGVSSVGGQTYYNGGTYTIPDGQIQVRSGHYGDKSVTKVYSYNATGDPINGSWFVEMYIPGLSQTKVSVAGSFTTDGISPAGDPPSDLSVTNLSQTWNSVTGTFSVGDWGTTAADYMAARVYGQSGTARLENQFNGQSSVTTTITNNSVPLDGGITLKGCGTYKVDLFAQNSIGAVNTDDITIYTPPAPSQFTYTDPGGAGAKVFPVEFTGSVLNNNSTYSLANLNRTIRYKIDNGAWVYIDNATSVAVDFVTAFSVSVPAGSVATIEGWMEYYNEKSEVSTITLANTNSASHLYGSANGVSAEIIHLYCPVEGATRKVRKLYASVGGVAKKVFEDV